MNPTVRLYNTDDLARIESGADPWLTTLFANAKTYSEQGIAVRYRLLVSDELNEYQVCVGDLIETIHATDDQHAIRFAYAMWDAEAILDIVAITRSFRPISLPGAVA